MGPLAAPRSEYRRCAGGFNQGSKRNGDCVRMGAQCRVFATGGQPLKCGRARKEGSGMKGNRRRSNLGSHPRFENEAKRYDSGPISPQSDSSNFGRPEETRKAKPTIVKIHNLRGQHLSTQISSLPSQGGLLRRHAFRDSGQRPHRCGMGVATPQVPRGGSPQARTMLSPPQA